MRDRLVIAASTLIVGAVLFAQTPAQQQTPPVFRGGTTVVPLTVTVVDQSGAPVKDLKASDFTVYENKRPRTLSISSRRRSCQARFHPCPRRSPTAFETTA